MVNPISKAAFETQIDNAFSEHGTVVATLRAAFPDALAMYAFGSRVQGQSRPDSDLDLAVLVAGYAQPLQLWEVSGQLADQVDCSVDLLDLHGDAAPSSDPGATPVGPPASRWAV